MIPRVVRVAMGFFTGAINLYVGRNLVCCILTLSHHTRVVIQPFMELKLQPKFYIVLEINKYH